MQISAAILDSLEALERLDIPIEDVTTINELRQMLLDEFGITAVSDLNLTRESLQKMMKTAAFVKKELIPLGVKPVRVEYPSGKIITRFSIAGFRGLYGVEAVNEYLQAQTE